MSNGYLNVALMGAVAVAFSVAFALIARYVGPRRATPNKDSTYETGIPVTGGLLGRLSVKFFLVAILFLLFDLEVVFLYPGAVALRGAGLGGLAELLVFVVVLLVGWLFVVRSGVLDWGTPPPPWARKPK